MDLLPLALPYDFVAAKIDPSWQKIRFGLAQDLLDPDAASQVAAARLVLDAAPPPALVELACLDAGESPRALVDTLAAAEPPEDPEEVAHAWLYLVLAWIHEHRASYDDPLQMVEIVYADFDYPEEIAGFVRYMPADPTASPPGEPQLYARWAAWLAAQAPRHAPR